MSQKCNHFEPILLVFLRVLRVAQRFVVIAFLNFFLLFPYLLPYSAATFVNICNVKYTFKQIQKRAND